MSNSNEITPKFEFSVDDYPSLFRFEGCFLDLHLILRCDEGNLGKSPSAESSTLKQSFSPTDTPVGSPQRGGDQQHGSPASTISHRSTKAEHHTHSFSNGFLRATVLSLEKRLKQEVAWFNSKMRALPLYSIDDATNIQFRTNNAYTTRIN